jgi:hypothetical protein
MHYSLSWMKLSWLGHALMAGQSLLTFLATQWSGGSDETADEDPLEKCRDLRSYRFGQKRIVP